MMMAHRLSAGSLDRGDNRWLGRASQAIGPLKVAGPADTWPCAPETLQSEVPTDFGSSTGHGFFAWWWWSAAVHLVGMIIFVAQSSMLWLEACD